MAFTHSVCLCLVLTSLFFCQTLSGSLPHLTFSSPSWIKDEWCFFYHFCLCMGVCVFCVCVMSPAWPCLSEAEPCCQCMCALCMCVKEKDEEMKLCAPPPCQAKNETLNTSQSVKQAAKIETDLLFHNYTTKLILLTKSGIRYDKWLQIWK